MKRSIVLAFFCVLAPSHLVTAASLVHPHLNDTRFFWHYFVAWLAVTAYFSWVMIAQSRSVRWNPRRAVHTYYVLPLLAITALHLAFYAFQRPELPQFIQAVQANGDSPVGAEDLRVANAPMRSPARVFEALGELALVLTRRGYFFLKTIVIVTTPVWLWLLSFFVALFFARYR